MAGVVDTDADGGMSVTTGNELESSAQLTGVEVVGLGSDGSLVGTSASVVGISTILFATYL